MRLLSVLALPAAFGESRELSIPLPYDLQLSGETLRVELAWIDGEGRLRMRERPLELVVGSTD